MKQKVWFITGASRGLGLAIAKAALEIGDNVVATVRKNGKDLESTIGESDRLLVVQLDVTDEQQVKAGVERAVGRFGGIDVLVNNAGYGFLAATEEASDEEVRKQYDTNVFGLLNVTRATLPHMRRQRSGHIINISSFLGYHISVPGFGIYGSTKFAVEGLSEGLILEVKSLGINVTSVAPGLFRTSFASPESFHSSRQVIDDYNETVGNVRRSFGQLDGSQSGDPSKLAQIIIQLASHKNPPLHMPIGKDSRAAFTAKIELMQNEAPGFDGFGINTDYEKSRE